MELDDLVGKVIDKVEWVKADPEGNSYVRFYCGEEMYHFDAIGDCCSDSWIEYFEGIDEIIGTPVIKIDEKPLKTIEETYCSQTDQYQIDIVTAKGTATIDFRNNNNGYYGGWLAFNRGCSTP